MKKTLSFILLHHWVLNTEENNYRCYQINVRGTENVLDICLRKVLKNLFMPLIPKFMVNL